MQVHVPHWPIDRVGRIATMLWPYVAMVVLLPGGSVLAFALWLLQCIRKAIAHSAEITS